MPLPELAVSLPVPGVPAAAVVDLARRCEDWGYRSCWLAEVQGPDAVSVAGALAVTTDLELGIAVLPVQTRTAMVLGMTAVTLAELTGGRFTLGLGASSEVIVERWAGQPFDRPLRHVRETVEALRPILAGGRGSYAGELVRMDGYRPHATPAEPVPLVLGALNQRSLRMVGELGVDGVALNQLAPHHVPLVLDAIRTGAGGALPDGFRVVARLFCIVTDDVAAGRALVKHVFAPYIATSVYNRFYRWMGYEDVAEAVRAAGRDRRAAASAITDEVVDEVFLIGDGPAIARRVRAFVDAGVTVPMIAPLVEDPVTAARSLQAIAAAWPGR